MNNVYLGSDWHFSKWSKSKHYLKYNVDKVREIMEKYKKTVKKNDLFIFLGDLSEFRDDNPNPIKYALSDIKNLPGSKIFVRGNNDKEDSEFYIKLGFKICEDSINLDDFVFTHEPYEVTGDKINIHGHIHGAGEYWYCNERNHVDAFTELFDLYPVKIEELLRTGKFIDKSVLSSDKINKAKAELFKMVK